MFFRGQRVQEVESAVQALEELEGVPDPVGGYTLQSASYLALG